MLVAVNFHYVRPTFEAPYPSIHGVTPDQFETQLKVLSRAGQFVSAAEVRRAILGADFPARAILITFDDGLREQYEHAWPVLQRLGIPALFFVNTAPVAEARVLTVHKIHLLRSRVAPSDFLAMLHQAALQHRMGVSLEVPVERAKQQYRYDTPEAAQVKYLLNIQLGRAERDPLIASCFQQVFGSDEAQLSRELYMDVAQLRELDGCIGSHTHSHLPLGLLAPREVREEVELASTHLDTWLGHRPYALSYPYGSRDVCTDPVSQIAAGAGIEFAFTMERAVNRSLSTPQFLARIDSNDAPGGKGCKFEPQELFDALPAAAWFANAPSKPQR